MIPQAVTGWLVEEGFGEIRNSHSVSGGCINNGAVLEAEAGQSFFLKTNFAAPKDMFAREAEGLAALRQHAGLRIPEVHLVGEDFLLLEDLKPSSPAKDYWHKFGTQLARLHKITNPQFGFEHDNYIGRTPQVNSWSGDGFEFFGQHRLLYQAQLARDKHLLDSKEVIQVEALTKRLTELIPPQPASIIHGDLWKGNAITDEKGQPVLIDPATHYGWAEAELAMTGLFGGFAADFYKAYEEMHPLETGWRERFPIYNLYHLLNHLNLFGMGYHSQVISIINRYT